MTTHSPSTAPVLLLAFNRPDFTRKVLDAIRIVKPSRLFFAVDGPRKQIPEETTIVDEVKGAIQTVDWDCKISTLFRKSNLGCKAAVSQAISWFFENVEAGIIIEDDCLPSASFFDFANDLLHRFGDDERIGTISGDNFDTGELVTAYSYHFSHFPHLWGWATWRRAWLKYDLEMRLWPEARDKALLHDIFPASAVKYWSRIMDDTYSGRIDTWDYQWMFSCWLNRYLAITPNVNLVSNIGCGDYRATNTLHLGNPLGRVPRAEMRFPIVHPPCVVPDTNADKLIMSKISWRPSIFWRVVRRLHCLGGKLATRGDARFR